MTQTFLTRQVLEQAACKCFLFPFTCEAKEIGDVYMQASPGVFHKAVHVFWSFSCHRLSIVIIVNFLAC